MIAAAALLLALAAAAEKPSPPQVYAQVTVRHGVILRIPRRPEQQAQTKWRERNAPECIPAQWLAGAIPKGDHIDLLLRGGSRMRAELESRCPAIDFYSGFYVKPGPDGKICEDRDAIHARSGGKCGIERFRSLVPERKKR